MQAILDGIDGGLKLPKTWPRNLSSLVAILLSAILAAIVFDVGNPGSAVALCLLLPFALVMRDWLATPRSWLDHALPGMSAIAWFGVALDPGWLNVSLTWILLTATAVATRSAGGATALPLLRGVGWSGLMTPKQIFADGFVAAKLVNRQASRFPRLQFSTVMLPLVAVVTFGLLLASANPVIENVLLAFDLDRPLRWFITVLDVMTSWAGFVFVCAALLLWPILRSNTSARQSTVDDTVEAPFWHRMFFRPATVVATLLLLNLLFATENALDIWHVWLKAELPEGMSHAQYVHRGSYTLIVTAILAGLLMVFALWKGTATEQSSIVRGLVYVWTLQNLLLVASSAKRTFDYIDAFGWTEWRLAGLLWMGLVFFGLASIIWRVARNRDSLWLVNTNLVAATLLLLFCAVMDMRGFIAQQNINQALQNPQERVDFDYLGALGPSSLPAIAHYESHLRGKIDSAGRPESHEGSAYLVARCALVASRLRSELKLAQTDWRSWTWRFTGQTEDARP